MEEKESGEIPLTSATADDAISNPSTGHEEDRPPDILRPEQDKKIPDAQNAEIPSGNVAAVSTLDPYLYTKREEFTSEIFKIEVGGLPSRFGYGELKKLLNKTLHLNSHKLKATTSNSTWAFVTFRCEEDRERALKTLNGYKWKGRTLTVKKANPAADPLIRKRQTSRNGPVEDGGMPDAKKVKLDEDAPVGTSSLKNAVMPLWNTPYEDQVKMKEQELKKILVKLGRQIERVHGTCGPPAWLKEHRKEHDFMCCPLESFHPSPVVDAYRNKCEFTVGWDPLDRQKTVGFRLARYAAGSMSVADPSECTIVSKNILTVVQAFQDYVRKSDKNPYNPEDHTGHWRQLTVRTTRTGGTMAIVVMHPQDLSKDEVEGVKKDLADYFWSGPGTSAGVTSLYFQTFAKRVSEATSIDHVCGDRHIQETMLDLHFRISPTAFFQINTPAAEVLYAVVGDVADLQPSTTLLDICCGTGTIGLFLAKRVRNVIGIEMVASAIEDARHNAKSNGLDNVEFHCGKVEDVLMPILVRLSGKDAIAVVDPPRAGLHTKVIKMIRGCKQLQRLIYVSCDPAAAISNFTDLCRPESNQYRERPFAVKKAVAVDLFPHTSHCELVVLLERDDDQKSS